MGSDGMRYSLVSREIIDIQLQKMLAGEGLDGFKSGNLFSVKNLKLK